MSWKGQYLPNCKNFLDFCKNFLDSNADKVFLTLPPLPSPETKIEIPLNLVPAFIAMSPIAFRGISAAVGFKRVRTKLTFINAAANAANIKHQNLTLALITFK